MNENRVAVAAIVLAAGQGTRFAAEASGAFKLLASYKGAPLVRHAVAAAGASRAHPVIVVTGHRPGDVEAALSDLSPIFIHNASYERGLATSLKAGIAALPSGSCGVLVLLGDMPGVSAAVLDTLIEAFERDPGCDAVVPVCGRRRGNPVLLGRTLFQAVQTQSGDVGARKLLADAARVIEIAVDDRAVMIDVDTPTSLAEFD